MTTYLVKAIASSIDRIIGIAPIRAQPSVHSLMRHARDDSLLRNSMYIMAATALMSATGYVYWTLAARLYSAPDVGLAAALIGGMLLAAQLANLGLGAALVQHLPQCHADHAWSLTVNAASAAGTVASLVVGTIFVIVLPLVSPQFAMINRQPGYAGALILGVMLATVAGLLDQMFIAERSAGNTLVREGAFALLRIPLLIIPLLLVRAGAGVILWSWVLGDAISLVGAVFLLIPRLRRAYRPAMRGMLTRIRSMLSSLLGHHLVNIGADAPMWLLPVLVAVRLSASANAYFYTTWMLGNIFFMISPAVANSLFAEGSHAPSDLVRKARSSVLIIGVLLCPAMLVALLGGRFFLSVFGASYAQHGQVLLMILVFSAVPDAITNVYVAMLRVQRYLRMAALLNLGMAAFAMALTWVFLPVLGIAGVGWAWLIAQTAGTIVAAAHAMMTAIRRRVVDSQE